MVGKRKIDSLRANIAKMAKAAEADNGQEFQQACKEIPNLLDLDQKDPDRLLADGLSSQDSRSRAQRVGIFNFRVYRVRVLLKTSGSGRVSGIFAKKNINRVFSGIENLDRLFSGTS